MISFLLLFHSGFSFNGIVQAKFFIFFFQNAKLSQTGKNRRLDIVPCKVYDQKSTLPIFVVQFDVVSRTIYYLIRVGELPIRVSQSSINFQSYINAVLMVITRMTTVGHNDFTPKTVPDRIINIFMITCGIYLMSLTIIILFQTLELKKNE